jgi:alanine racemase
MKKHSRVRALVSLDAIAYNFEEMHKKLKGNTRMIAVIKADGYGHGAIEIARLVEGYPYLYGFAVAAAEEAFALRDAGITKPILILGHVFEEHFEALISKDISMTVSDAALACLINRAAETLGKTARIHLALDTGMTRIGFADKAESIPEIRKIQELSNIHIEGMFTHFAKADETDLQPAIVQMKRFQNFARTLEKEGISIPLLHCSNSAGIMRLEEAQMDLVRAGITIYGLYPSNEVDRNLLKLRPAMELKSTVSYVKDVPAGVGISYGGTYVTDKPIRVATIPVGYADGYPRSLSNKGYVLIHGKRAPILGRICMDQFMVNVTGIQDVNAGDQVTLIGNDGDACILMEELGDLSGRFAYEFACGISARVPRVYLRGGEEYEP